MRQTAGICFLAATPTGSRRRGDCQARMSNAPSLIFLLHIGSLFFASCMLAIASLKDIAVRTVPDLAPIGLAILGVAVRLAEGNAASGFLASIAVLLLAALCWRFGWLGGGDVKLLAACALLVPPTLVPQLVLLTALSGGVLALLYLVLGCVAPASHMPVSAQRPLSLAGRIVRAEWWRIKRRAPLPYGCAITAATVLILSGW